MYFFFKLKRKCNPVTSPMTHTNMDTYIHVRSICVLNHPPPDCSRVAVKTYKTRRRPYRSISTVSGTYGSVWHPKETKAPGIGGALSGPRVSAAKDHSRERLSYDPITLDGKVTHPPGRISNPSFAKHGGYTHNNKNGRLGKSLVDIFPQTRRSPFTRRVARRLQPPRSLSKYRHRKFIRGCVLCGFARVVYYTTIAKQVLKLSLGVDFSVDLPGLSGPQSRFGDTTA